MSRLLSFNKLLIYCNHWNSIRRSCCQHELRMITCLFRNEVMEHKDFRKPLISNILKPVMTVLHTATCTNFIYFLDYIRRTRKKRNLVRPLPQIQSKMQWRVAGKEFAAAMEWVKIFINFTFTAGLAGETFASAAISLPCVPVNQKIRLMWVTHNS